MILQIPSIILWNAVHFRIETLIWNAILVENLN